MKKIFPVITTCILMLVCCTKDPSANNAHYPSVIAVTYASDNMQVSATSFTANDWLNVDFTVAADSVEWWVSDTATNPYDTIPYYPGSDTIITYPDTVINYPGDTTQYPHDTIPQLPGDSSYYPSNDSTGYDTVQVPPQDTTVNPPQDSILYNTHYGYIIKTNGSNLKIQVTKQGNYTVEARAYRKNSNGSYTLIKTGYVKLSAR